MNTTMKLERSWQFNADLYENKTHKIDYDKNYKVEIMRTCFGEVEFAISQTRDTYFTFSALGLGFDPKVH